MIFIKQMAICFISGEKVKKKTKKKVSNDDAI